MTTRIVWKNEDKSKQDLTGINLENAFLKKCNFTNSIFGSVKNATFLDCILTNSYFRFDSLISTEFRWTNILEKEKSLASIIFVPNTQQEIDQNIANIQTNLNKIEYLDTATIREAMVNLFLLIAHREKHARTKARLQEVVITLKTRMDLCHDEILNSFLIKWHPDTEMMRALLMVLKEKQIIFNFYKERGTIQTLYNLYKNLRFNRQDFEL